MNAAGSRAELLWKAISPNNPRNARKARISLRLTRKPETRNLPRPSSPSGLGFRKSIHELILSLVFARVGLDLCAVHADGAHLRHMGEKPLECLAVAPAGGADRVVIGMSSREDVANSRIVAARLLYDPRAEAADRLSPTGCYGVGIPGSCGGSSATSASRYSAAITRRCPELSCRPPGRARASQSFSKAPMISRRSR